MRGTSVSALNPADLLVSKRRRLRDGSGAAHRPAGPRVDNLPGCHKAKPYCLSLCACRDATGIELHRISSLRWCVARTLDEERRNGRRSRPWFSQLRLAFMGLFVSYTFVNDPASAVERQLPTLHLNANEPIGTAVGIYPGRVVWVHRPEATNEKLRPASVGHEWYRPENNNQPVVDTMVSTAIRRLTGTSSDSAAWNAIFRFHNSTRGKGAVGYAPGEKVFIKTNATSSWSGQFKPPISVRAQASCTMPSPKHRLPSSFPCCVNW